MKVKKYIHNKYFIDILIFTVFFFGVEVIFRAVEGFSFFDWATFRIFLSSFCFSIVLHFFITFIKSERARNIIRLIFLLIVSIYAWMQAGFNNFLGVYISMGTSSQAGAVTSYIKEFLVSYKIEYYFILAPFLLYIVYIILNYKKRTNPSYKVGVKPRIFSVCIALFSSAIYIATLYIPFMQNPIQMISNKNLFFSPTNSSIAVNQYGTTVYGILDVKQLLFPVYIIDNGFSEPDDEEEPTRVFDDTFWKEVMAEEKNSTLKALDQYFLSRSISQINDYTGYFEGKNLIVIMMESVNNIILHEEYYPNFSKILEHAWYWENNYSPRNACATGDNEFSGMTSIYALNTACTANVYQTNEYFTSIFNRFKNSGYTVTSYHNLDSTYYARDIFHIHMGSMAYYDGNDLGISFDSNNYIEWPSDVELIEKSAAIFTQDTPFMAWITTVTPHQPYDGDSIYGDKYFSLFDDTNYSDTLKRYMSKLKVTDDALGVLLDTLEAKGVLEDTVIVLYGDHYPYGLVDEDVQAAVDYDVSDFYEIEQTPFVIYNSELEPQNFSQKTSYMNILPTLANLFNLEYDPRFYFGEDLFSPTFSNRIVFADSSWEDSVARYDARSGMVTYFGEKTYSTNELQAINLEINQKKQMSKLAVTTNYFADLEEKLSKKRAEQEDVNKEQDKEELNE